MRVDHVIVRGVLTRRWQQATATSQFALEEDLALPDYDGEGRVEALFAVRHWPLLAGLRVP